MKLAPLGSTGAPLMSVFHQLSRGNKGTGWGSAPPPICPAAGAWPAAAASTSAAAKARAAAARGRGLDDSDWPARDRKGGGVMAFPLRRTSLREEVFEV